MSIETVPGWPRIEAITREDGTGEVTVNGTSHPIATATRAEARSAIIAVVVDIAAKMGRAVRVATTGPDGDWPLIVHPDGTVEPGEAGASRRSRRGESDAREEPAVAPSLDVAPPAGGEPTGGAWVRRGAPDADIPPRPTTRRELRQSFLTRVQVEEPAANGVRGVVTRLGVRVSPSDAERRERADVLAVSQHWPGPRTIAVVNGKGGANKTPTTILLAAVFARHGGAGVLTWDNNQTRGTLGWRTEQGPHEATLLELLPQSERLLSTSAQSAELARYVHHQTRDKFDVLRSKPMALAHEQRFEPADVDAIHAVAAKYYRLIIIDSGNDESDPMWQRMIDHADQLVVATTTRDDHAEAGALLLEALAGRDERSADLAHQAVVVVSQADPTADRGEVQRTMAGYSTLARVAVTIPFDPAMVDGVLHHGALRPATRRAWLAAGAAVARGL